MKDKKKIVIGVLCALIMIMAVGYALLSQQLSITGSAAITSNWQVEITNITQKEKSAGATTNNTNYTATTASFNTSLTSPGDYALYEVTVTNKGTLDAVLSAEPTITTGNNEAITYELEGIRRGDKILKNNKTDTFTIKVTYNPSTTQQPSTLTSNIEITLSYEQDLGQVVVENNVYAFHTTTLAANASYSDLQTIMSDENRQLYQDGTELSQVHPYYLKYTINGDEITKRYVCFIAYNTEHCMQGGDGGAAYQDNVLVLQGVQSWFTSNGGSCSINASGDSSSCDGAGFGGVGENSAGRVNAYDGDGTCFVSSYGYSYCTE